MSVQANAPYQDRIEEDGSVLIYEGHDVPRTAENPVPKELDQPEHLPSGRLAENGKFAKSANDFKAGIQPPDVVWVYEKIKKGIWSDNGPFHLVDAWREQDERRSVFKFKLVAVEAESDETTTAAPNQMNPRSRIIPSSVKLEVWQRDGGHCVMCGAADELHFDHIVPYSKGGTSMKSDNIQLLCARHNLQKRDRIE